MKHYYVEASILAVAICVFGFFVQKSLLRFVDKERSVTVKGLSEREVPADKVIWPLVYKELGNDPSELYQRFEKKNSMVVAFLKKYGLSEKEITINPPQIKDRFADSWSQTGISDRYVASSVIIVSSVQVELVREIMMQQTELMKAGIALVSEEYGNNMVRYEFTGLNDVKPEMIEESTKNARMAAEKFAKDSDSELGKIKRAYQGQFSIENRDANTPYIKRIRVVTTIDYSLED